MKCPSCGKEKQQNEFKWLPSKKCYSVKCLNCSINRKKAYKAIKDSGASKKYMEKI